MASQHKPAQKTQNDTYSYQGKSSRLSSTAEADLQRPHKGKAAKPTKREIPVK